MTQILSIVQSNIDDRHILRAHDILNSGGVVLVPTETGYCFIGDACQDSTHDKFLQLRKGHPKTKPFSLLCKDISQVSKLALLSTQVFRIAARAWPGPYTFILSCSKNTPKIASGPKRKTVGIRISNHPVVKRLMADIDKPLLITSVTDEDELILQDYFNQDDQEDFWWTQVNSICTHINTGKIDLALENDEFVPMQVSTVVDFTQEPYTLIRDGGWDLDILGFES